MIQQWDSQICRSPNPDRLFSNSHIKITTPKFCRFLLIHCILNTSSISLLFGFFVLPLTGSKNLKRLLFLSDHNRYSPQTIWNSLQVDWISSVPELIWRNIRGIFLISETVRHSGKAVLPASINCLITPKRYPT